ncbi:hypothetical protein MD484_g2713, partial [Candolleomyces efflorescens]
MILDSHKLPLPDDPTPLDAPPSYDTISSPRASYRSTATASAPTSGDVKPSLYSPTGSSSLSPRSAYGSSSRSAGSSSGGCAPPHGKPSWFNFTASRTEKDVKTTVLGLVRDLVREHHSDSSAPAGILQSCAAACEAHSLSLATILQEKSIEGHTPLYWAIVKRKPDEELLEDSTIPDMLIALLSHATPLNRSTIMDIRHACLVTSDQRLFQRLRMSPEFATVSGSDQMLLGVTLPHDEIEVEELPGEEGDFVVHFVIPHFQKRMMVTQEIVLEFIARCRMWKLTFAITTKNNYGVGPELGSWTITLALEGTSPPTWVDSRVVIPDPLSLVPHSPPPPPPLPPSSPPASPATSPPTTAQSMTTFFQNLGKPNQAPKAPVPKPPQVRPPLSIRIPCRQRLEAWSSSFTKGYQAVVSLEDSPSATTLQYAGNPYIAADEKLRGSLEAKLRMPEQDCVIC